MEQISLQAENREIGKGITRAVRRAGRIPVVLYGNKMAPRSLSIEAHTLNTILNKKGENVIFSLELGKEKYAALIREVQQDPVSEAILHVDFLQIDMDKEIETDVPLELTGTAEGVAVQGGVLEIHRRLLRVRCQPRALPEKIEVDITPLDIGMALHVSDIVIPEGVMVMTEPRLTIVTVAAPTKMEEPTTGVEDEAVEGEDVEGAPEAAADAAPAEGAKEEKPE